jgi:pimeloyl-ACP methyl ester carboxylesterase
LQVGDDAVEYEDRGAGEPILLVHGGVFADWFTPVVASDALDGFRVIRVRRAGYAGGSEPTAHRTLADHARHCGLLLDALGLARAHVCGHSSGALVGLQLALDRPGVVHGLVLLEPAPAGALGGPVDQAAADLIGGAMAAWAAGDSATGVDRFLTAVGGPHHRAVLQQELGPEGYARAVRESSAFPQEVAAVRTWQFGPAEARRISAPMLIVQGGTTADVAVLRPDSVARLAALVPHARVGVLAGASHLMPLEDPVGVGALIADFVQAHPIGGAPDLPAYAKDPLGHDA